MASGWYLESAALLFWLILLLLAAMCASAALRDRRAENAWSDEYFLIPTGSSEDFTTTASKASAAAGCCSAMGGSAARDALDDILSRWFEALGGLRNLCESLLEGLQPSGLPLSSRAAALVFALVAGNARRQTGAALGLSSDIVRFILEDEDLGKLLEEVSTTSELGRSDKARAWLYLHSSVLRQVDACWQDFDSWGKVPAAARRLMVAFHPVSSIFLRCRLLPHSHRALLLACDLLGSLMLAALFFDGSGMALKRGSRLGCQGGQGMWQLLGSLVAIALGSMLLADVPVIIISSLHGRSFKKVPHEDSAASLRQLQAWRLQDQILWCVGCGYCLSCTTFILLFLANVDPTDLPSWGVSTLLQLGQEHVLIPLVIAVTIPGFTAASLLLLCKCRGTGVKELLSEQRSQRCQEGNWQAVLLEI